MQFFSRLKSPDNLLNLPNLLTLVRILLLPPLAVLLAFDSDQPPFERDWMFRFSPGRVAAVVVLIAGFTDLMDGYLARRWKIESLLGKFLDPVADKLFLLVGLVMLLEIDRVPAWLVIALLSREFLVTALRGVAAGEGIIISAGQTGKFKLTLQLIGLGMVMWYGTLFYLSAYQFGMYILYAALSISLISGYQYLSDFFIELRRKRERERLSQLDPR